MLTYQRFHVSETDHFEETKYPQVNTALDAIIRQLGDAASTPGAAMLLSFVKHHRIDSKAVAHHPALASMISTRELPLTALEELFEASKLNPLFQKELEAHIVAYLNSRNSALSPTTFSI